MGYVSCRVILQRHDGIFDFMRTLEKEEDMQIFMQRFLDAREHGDPEYNYIEDEMVNPVLREAERRRLAGPAVATEVPQSSVPSRTGTVKLNAWKELLLFCCVFTIVVLVFTQV